MDDIPLRQAPWRRSLSRVVTVMGAERTPMMLVLMMASMLILTGLTIVTTLLGLIMIFIGGAALRQAAKVHPQASAVYFEFFRYRKYYPAVRQFPTSEPYRSVCEQSRKGLL